MRELKFRAWNHSIRELKKVLSINFTGKYCVVDRAERNVRNSRIQQLKIGG